MPYASMNLVWNYKIYIYKYGKKYGKKHILFMKKVGRTSNGSGTKFIVYNLQ